MVKVVNDIIIYVGFMESPLPNVTNLSWVMLYKYTSRSPHGMEKVLISGSNSKSASGHDILSNVQVIDEFEGVQNLFTTHYD